MKAFAYRVATSEEQACKLLGEKSLPLAGGTSILNLMKGYVVQPDTLVSITKLPGAATIEALPAGAGFKVGAGVRIADMAGHPEIAKGYPALVESALHVASPQIRNMGTIGGNLCQRPSCWYFCQEAFDCLKRGGKTCPAKEGENDYHAILGTDGPCVMAHPSSLAPALVALGARLRIAGPTGAKEISIEELFTAPKTDPLRETILAPNEIVTHILLGPASPLSAAYEIRGKESNDWPLVIAAAALKIEGGNCSDARLCLGAVAPVPWRPQAAEAALKGKPVSEETARAAADASVAGAAPLSQNAYKVKLAHTAVKRAILLAASRGK